MADPIPVTKLADTKTTVTIGWKQPAGQQGYIPTIDGSEFLTDGKRHPSFSVTASSARIGKPADETTPASKHTYGVNLLGITQEGSWSANPSRQASWTTGPLGSANIFPSRPGAFVIDYPGIIGGTFAQVQQLIQMREGFIGRKFAGIHTGMFWERGSLIPDDAGDHQLEWIHGRGQIPCLSAHVYYTIPETNQGLADPTWTAIADWLKGLGFPVMMRMWWEFNNPAGFPWCVGGTTDIGAPFIAAWQRVVAIFKQRGVNNVGFWWCPMEGGDRDGMESSYPGDAYVDWVGSDVYSSCYASETSCWQGYAGPGWASFEQLALWTGMPHQCALDLYGTRKPFVYGEVGCVLDPARPDLKASWFPALAISLSTRGSGACGISFFDVDASSLEGPRSNWSLAYGTGSLTGFAQMAAHPWMNA